MALSTFRFLSFTSSLALDTSIISQTHNHDQLNWRSDGEVMVIYEGWLIKHEMGWKRKSQKDARFPVFKDNLELIDAHNSQNLTYKLGLNRFADSSNGEYRAMYLGTKTDNDKRRRAMKAKNTARRYAYYAGDVLPLHVDWRVKGAIDPIKDQKSGEA